MVLNDSVQRLSWLLFLFSSVHLGARLLRAGNLVSFLFLSAYESSAFESGSVGQWGASLWKIFSLGVLVTVKKRELVTGSREEWSGSWAAAGWTMEGLWSFWSGLGSDWAFMGSEDLASRGPSYWPGPGRTAVVLELRWSPIVTCGDGMGS